jgi:predicted SAM-dependent methyltransferase
MIRINLGCGNDWKVGYINVDIVDLKGVDMVEDLNQFPYPFPDEYADEILMKDVIEHLDNPMKVIQECWRILKPEGILKIKVVYWNHHLSYGDPQHKHAFSADYFLFFTGRKREYYMNHHFRDFNIKWIFDSHARIKYGDNEKILLEKAYHHCNIIQGMEVELLK